MKTKTTLLSLFYHSFLYCFLKAWLPENPSEDYNAGVHYCATDQMMRKGFENNSKFEQRHSDIEKAIYESLSENGSIEKSSPPPYILPVVVHIIHENGLENISDAQVLDGMDHLNQAFENIDYYDQGTGVNTQIQFCLAKRTPEGTFTTGINRVVSPLTNVDMDS